MKFSRFYFTYHEDETVSVSVLKGKERIHVGTYPSREAADEGKVMWLKCRLNKELYGDDDDDTN